MPTTITPAITSAVNSTTQNLFTISQVDGVTSYGTMPSGSTVTLDTITLAVGTDIAYDINQGEWTLDGTANIAYTLTASVTTRNVNPDSTYGFYVVGGNLIGTTAQVGQPLTVSTLNDTGNAINVSLVINSADGQAFSYPSQVTNAIATVTEVSGYSVA